MKINTKITLTFLCISALSIIAASLVTSWLGTRFGEQALKAMIEKKLTATREGKKIQIENYFHTIEDRVRVFSKSQIVINAMQEFKAAFHQYPDASKAERKEQQYSQLRQFYIDAYLQEHKKTSTGTAIDIDLVLNKLDHKTIALQHLYIKENPYPLGRKHKFIYTGGKSDYELTHKKYHPHLLDYLEIFGYYDIFLVEPESGHIVYSVFKEFDFASSLTTGPYADSGIARAFNKTRELNDKDAVALADFQPYMPAYGHQASFISSPIYDGDKKIGVLIIQVPIDQINQIIAENGQTGYGLGKSGEVYLIGPDYKIRNQSRLFTEDRKKYLAELARFGYADTAINAIKRKDSTIGLKQVNTESTEAALNGKTGFLATKNYRGVSVFSSYTPLKIKDLNWVILSEIDQEEATALVNNLFEKNLVYSLKVMVLILIITAIAGTFFSRSLSRPMTSMINAITHCVNDIVDGRGDLTFKLAHEKKDETGELASKINRFIGVIRDIVKKFGAATVQVADAAEKMSAFVVKTNQGISKQYTETKQVMTTMSEMKMTAQEVAQNAENAAVATNKASKKSDAGLEVVQNAIDKVDCLANEIRKTKNVIEQLEKNSKSIGSVLEVIHNITNQTNLLALNATIEAARAGEQGRGFSVVADEVRTLANHTQDSTQEIQHMIDELQKNMREAVLLMNKSCTKAKSSASHANEAGVVIAEIKQEITNIDQLNRQIAVAAKEQSCVAEEINKNIFSISEIGKETSSEAEQITSSGKNLSRLASSLKKQVAQYKV